MKEGNKKGNINKRPTIPEPSDPPAAQPKFTTHNVPKDLKKTHVDCGAGDFANKQDVCSVCGGVRLECWSSYRYTTVSLCRCQLSDYEIIGYNDIGNPIFEHIEERMTISAEDVVKFEKELEDRFRQIAEEQDFGVVFKYATISKLDDGTFQAKLRYDTCCPAGLHNCSGCQGTMSYGDQDPMRHTYKTIIACSGNADHAIEKIFKEFKEKK